MSQEMNVLRCYSCKMYQVHIVKKARKWHCKLCNAKQSIQQIYFQGSGKDCRVCVQNLNLKSNDVSFSLHPHQESSNDSCNATNITQEIDIDESIKNKQAKYVDSPWKESSFDEENAFFDNIPEVEDIITNEKSGYTAVNNDSCNIENTLDDCNSGNEDIINETENLCSTSSNSNIEDKCNLEDNGETSRDNDTVSIFETYSELGDPLI